MTSEARGGGRSRNYTVSQHLLLNNLLPGTGGRPLRVRVLGRCWLPLDFQGGFYAAVSARWWRAGGQLPRRRVQQRGVHREAVRQQHVQVLPVPAGGVGCRKEAAVRFTFELKLLDSTWRYHLVLTAERLLDVGADE